MSKLIKYLTGIICFAFLSSFVQVNNSKDILIKMNKAYLNKSYKMNYEVVTKNTTDSKILSNYKGMVAKQDDYRYIKTGNNITLLNKKHFLYVDHFQKLIVFNKVTRANKENLEFDIISWLDTSLNKFKMSYKSKLNGNHIIEIMVENESYDKLTLYVDSKTSYLKKISYQFTEEGYEFDLMTVTYSSISVGKKIDKKLFSTKPYIVSIINPKPTKKYSSYRFINQTQQ